VFISSANSNSVILYDRLVHMGGLSGIVTTSQTVSTTAINRTYPVVNTQAWLEIYTATGATSVTATITYTNQTGTTGKTGTCVIPASAKAGTIIPFSLASGDTSVESVQSVILSATTGTAGNFGITLAQRICTVPVVANIGQQLDFAGVGLPQIEPNACLAYIVLPSTTSTGTIISELTLIQG
jgi:hypothetical protein